MCEIYMYVHISQYIMSNKNESTKGKNTGIEHRSYPDRYRYFFFLTVNNNNNCIFFLKNKQDESNTISSRRIEKY